MAKVRKRTLPSGEIRWLADYVDAKGIRRSKQFEKRKDADSYLVTVRANLKSGVHVAESDSVSVARAGVLWLESADAAKLERATCDQYRQHLNLHIKPFIGALLLSKLSVPVCREFEDTLRREGRSPAMIRKVMTSFRSMLTDSQERGLIARNVARDLRRNRRKGKDDQAERRQKGKLKIGVDIPTPDEASAIIHAATGRWRAFFTVVILTGLRASELRGLRWVDVDFAGRGIAVRQRADRYNEIGRPKSEAGERVVPLPPIALNALREWKLICPRGEEGLVFPNGSGKVESLANIINRGLIPTQIAAGVTVPKLDKAGQPVKDDKGNGVMRAKYSGMHALRHFYASWCINRRVDGGMELPAKVVQERLGHSSIVMTMDLYGHLFPRGDDTEELARAESALLGARNTVATKPGKMQ